jgi:hypothetical protein
MYDVYVVSRLPALYSISTNKTETPPYSVITTLLLSTVRKLLSYELNPLKAKINLNYI